MLKQLRSKFIRIAMISVTLVVFLLCLIINIANFISTDNQLTLKLTAISENNGSMPEPPDATGPEKSDSTPPYEDTMPDGLAVNEITANFEGTANNNVIQNDPSSEKNDKDSQKNEFESWFKSDGKQTPPFTEEGMYSTRFFTLFFDDEGNITLSNLDRIAAVTSENADDYAQIALKNGEGFGYAGNYKYYVEKQGDNKWMAVFLDAYFELSSLKTIALISLIAMAFCIGAVYLVVILFSKRAVDPVIQSNIRQKQFITDASHELKTPITVISTSLSVLEMETGKQKWIDKARIQTEKLTELVNSLVTLSKMDEEESPLKFLDFNLSDAASETADSFSDFAYEKGHRLVCDIEPDIVYTGDEYSIRRVLSILLDNAIKYASGGSDIRLEIKKNKKGISIIASNKCDYINKEDLDRLFDRFYRPDKSRNSSTGGFGIGLSVACGIVNAHHGSIRADAAEGDTIVFTINL